MKATFNISYLIQKGKLKVDGQAPIMARLIVNSEMIHFSTQMSIEPNRWNTVTNRTVGLTKEEKKINAFLDELTASVQRRYYDLQASGEVVSASKIKQRLFSTDERSMSLIALCDQFIADYEKLVLTQDYGKESYFRYKVCRARVQEFLLTQYKIKDMPLADLDKRFLDKLYLWLRSEHGLNNNTAVKFLHRFSSIFKMARDNGWVTGDPFKLQKLHLDKVDRGYLTSEEIERIYTHEFATDRLTTIRDIFIFCCYTGLPYVDCKNLTYDHIVTWSDGNQWISIHRTKTKVPVNVRLLEVPLMIMGKYKGVARGNKVLPVPSNQKCSDYLKEIAEVCGIHKDLCYHMARHTFATTVTLSNGVPIESVSKMLGHTNIRTTQIYARITDQKVNKDMEVLSEKLNGIFSHPTEPSKQSKHEAARIADLNAIVHEMHLSI